MNDLLIVRIEQALSEGNKHLAKLERSVSLLNFFPVNIQSYGKLSEEEVEHIDQMIYRFTKLQDSMGLRLFPLVYEFVTGDSRRLPFMDILNGLEKYGVLTSVEKWQEYRALRNQLAHEYPNREQEIVDNLNLLVSELIEFLEIFKHVEAFYQNGGNQK